ncbi:MAG: DUF2383 domain-containing protein [Kofleriaceae bacterium]|nr:DUF2383 domain-containing protein [Kofleriaceae bacterium]
MTSKIVDREDENDDLIEQLNELIQLDFDAVRAYETAIDKLRDVSARGDLVLFKQDHERHIEDLSRAVLRLGGLPRDRGNLKGILLDGLTALRAATGDVGALRAMRMNERITNRAYIKALDDPLSMDTRAIVLANREDEQRHLLSIKQHLERLDEDYQDEIDDEEELLRSDSEFPWGAHPLA